MGEQSDREFEARLRAMVDGVKIEPAEPEPIPEFVPPERPDIFADLDEKLQAIEEKRLKAHAVVEAKAQPSQSTKESDADSRRGLARGIYIANILVGVPMVCFGIGWLVDWSAGGNAGKTIGIVLGATLGLIQAIRVVTSKP